MRERNYPSWSTWLRKSAVEIERVVDFPPDDGRDRALDGGCQEVQPLRPSGRDYDPDRLSPRLAGVRVVRSAMVAGRGWPPAGYTSAGRRTARRVSTRCRVTRSARCDVCSANRGRPRTSLSPLSRMHPWPWWPGLEENFVAMPPASNSASWEKTLSVSCSPSGCLKARMRCRRATVHCSCLPVRVNLLRCQ